MERKKKEQEKGKREKRGEKMDFRRGWKNIGFAAVTPRSPFPLFLTARILLFLATRAHSIFLVLQSGGEFSNVRHESTIGASNISLEDRRE